MKKLYTKCPVEYTVSIISDKWKVLIIRDLLEKEKRYSELMKSVVGISDKVLAKNLRELEQEVFFNRKRTRIKTNIKRDGKVRLKI